MKNNLTPDKTNNKHCIKCNPSLSPALYPTVTKYTTFQL